MVIRLPQKVTQIFGGKFFESFDTLTRMKSIYKLMGQDTKSIFLRI